jgi:predicted dehydrogenase
MHAVRRPVVGVSISRRRLLAAGAAAAAVSIVPRSVLGGAGVVPPSEKVNIAVLGVGGQGRTNIEALLRQPTAQVVALADPAETVDLSRFYYRTVAGRGPVKQAIEAYAGNRVNTYEDFRVLLDKEKGVDAVLVASPVHNHAILTISAMKAGKHVYCEKPLAHNVWEIRQVAKVAKETGVATQMGNHGHSKNAVRDCAEWIAAGAIGQIKEVHAWTGTGRWVNRRGLPPTSPPVPQGFNWDLWLGPRAHRPYSPEYAPFLWRAWYAFGGGSLGDMGCHNLDHAVTALKLVHPLSIEAEAPFVDTEVAASNARYVWKFAARGDMPPVTVTWWDDRSRMPTPSIIDSTDPRQRLGSAGGDGTMFVGEKGIITCEGFAGTARILPAELNRTFVRPPQTLPRVPGQDHHADWLQACKGGKPASSNFEVAAVLAEIVQLGVVALRTGQRIEWDPQNLKAVNCPAADPYIREPVRPGWELPV